MTEIYYLCGPDGSGKTTHAKLIIRYLQKQGKKVKYVWMRSPKILSKPLMAYCRLMGLTKYWYVNGKRIGIHEFYKSRIVSTIYPWLQLIDLKIMNFIMVKIPSLLKRYDYIILDRYVIDTVVDVIVDTRKNIILDSKLWHLYLNIMSKNIRTVILIADYDTIVKRRKEILHDPYYSQRIDLYNKVSDALKLPVINTFNNIDVTQKVIKKVLGVK